MRLQPIARTRRTFQRSILADLPASFEQNGRLIAPGSWTTRFAFIDDRASSITSTSNAVFEAGDAAHLRAVGAAINGVVRFDAVSDYAAVAVGAAWREQMNGAFEAVERMTFAFRDDFE
jgi:hypothetical protein